MTVTNDKKLLNKLLNPLKASVFFEQHYEQTYYHVSNRASNFYKDILSIQDIDDALKLRLIPLEKVYIIKEGKKMSMDEWCKIYPLKTETLLHPKGIYQSLEAGNSLVLNELNKFVPKLRHFTHQFNQENTINSWTNIYITPETAKAFRKHYDRHELFVLQIEGTKHWKLYDIVAEKPDDRQKEEPEIDYNALKPIKEIRLKPGDLLYIPRGMAHEAITTDTTSVHITLGWKTAKMVDVLKQLQAAALEHPYFRQNITAILDSGLDEGEMKTKFLQAFQAVLDQVPFQNRLRNIQSDFHSNYKGFGYEGSLRAYIDKEQINENTLIRPKRGVLFSLKTKGIMLQVLFDGKEEPFPLPLKASIEHIFSGKNIAIKDIKGNLPMDFRIKLVHKMLRKGMLEILESPKD